MSHNSAVLSILEKIASKDKDFRYMATSDLLNELQKDSFKVDGELEKKLSSALLTQLEDTSGDISGLAVKCLGLLVRRVSDMRIEDLSKALCDKVLNVKAKDQQRDIASIGLKTVIAEIPVLSTSTISNQVTTIITSKMLEGAGNKDNMDVVSEALDILTDLLSRFGGLVPAEHARIKECTLGYLGDVKVMLRKRAMSCLAAVSVHLNDALLEGVVTEILAQLASGKGLKADVVRLYIQAIGNISRSVGYRFGRHLPSAVPLIISHCEKAGEGDEELKEICLQAIDGFLQRCPLDSRTHLNTLLGVSLKYLKHDPNFVDDDMNEDEGGDGGDDDEDGDNEDDEEEEDYSDDEDISWKVRRAASKCLTAAVQAYPDAVSELYRQIAETLVARFKEREENVLNDIFSAYVTLSQQVASASRALPEADPASPLSLLRSDAPSTLKICARILSKSKSAKTRIGVLSVLHQLVDQLPASVADHAALLIPGVVNALNDKSGNSNLKIEALQFLRLLLASSSPLKFQTHIKAVSQVVCASAGERYYKVGGSAGERYYKVGGSAGESYYKVSAEALRVCEQLVVVLAPDAGSRVTQTLQPLIKPLFDAVMLRLSAQDQDQEVKEAAITAMSKFVALLADEISAEVPKVLQVFLERLRNEVTRLPTVRALATICSSVRTAADVSLILEPVVAELTSFLRKANRVLRQATLLSLEVLVQKYGQSMDVAGLVAAVDECVPIVADSELPLASLSLRFLVAVLEKQPSVASTVAEKVLPQAITLVKSPLLQGSALGSLQAFFLALGTAAGAGSETLMSKLLEAGTTRKAGKQAQHSIAQCVAVLCCSSSAGDSEVAKTVSGLLQRLSSGGATGGGVTGGAGQRLALLCLGEIGKRKDLSGMTQVESTIIASLASDIEDIKGAASVAYGGIVCGNVQKYLPSLLSAISASAGTPKRQYLLVQALGEVLGSGSSNSATISSGDLTQVLQLLLGNCDGEEECRTVVAECLGKLTLLHPTEVLKELQARVVAPSANVRVVVLSAVKASVVERPHPVDSCLASSLITFLSLMSDADRNVRRAAVVALSAVAHQKPSLVASHLSSLLPMLYEQTVVRPEMVRVVDLGPFKHTIDDGLELRKAAFECMDILLTACRPQIDAPTFMQHLESGLQDHYDVKMPSHMLLCRLAASEPSTVLAALERFVPPLEKTLATKVKSDAVKQELDRHEDMIRSCLRAIDALACIPGSATCAPFQAFLGKTVMAPAFKDKYLLLQRERAEADRGADAMDLS
ncbi:hypothetical protein CEUSTIGMA_g5786.t1 [Chlamydomonas eustigma]|uniref:TATA-binding protein interacting (TIP20) domain-containing protein n=1 Tax=Chlamydomonas eustigma TaxID=1157962 RepID=A0A250X5H3_9CHLO|nr:hypothetical protein CEUSTIGMA_g5786.t1 [Chlamydomonas eustigma]|eukprot:GAX78344.1 hypothetical protein CEUSTIGMA_g5786.t1 [Chlamydomonas eustigma]